jgi:hypothetical protein
MLITDDDSKSIVKTEDNENNKLVCFRALC